MTAHFLGFLLLSIYSGLGGGEVHNSEITSEQWFKTKSLKGCLLSLSNGSGNGNPNMTETFFDSNYPTSAKHHGLSHYFQQRLNMEHEHPRSPYNDKMPLFLPTRMVSEEAKWGGSILSPLPRGNEKPLLAKPHGHLESLDFHSLQSSNKNQ